MRDYEGGLRGLARSAVVAAMMTFLPAEAARSDDDPEPSPTQREFKEITETKSSVDGEPATAPPDPIHNLSEEAEGEVKRSGGVKIIPGKDWKHETPEQRDAHLRRIKATMPPNSHLLISVPKGDVWLIAGEADDPDAEPGDFPPDWKYQLLVLGSTLRYWTPAERAALPPAVVGERKVSQSDRRGVGSDSVARAAPEEP